MWMNEELEALRRSIAEQRAKWARVEEALARFGDAELAIPDEFFAAFENATRTLLPEPAGLRA
jgi:hypothetical protein